MGLSYSQLAQPQAAIRRKLLAAARLAKPAHARNGRRLPRVWFLTDPARVSDPVAIARRLPRGWGVIYRHFGAKDRLLVGAGLSRICRQRGLVLLVSADPALAAYIRADGVHWPEARLRGVRGRRPHSIETASAHSRAALACAHAFGVDAVFLSPVFPSHSPSAGKALGALRFRQIARTAPLTVYALGGVNERNAARAIPHSAGYAAIEAVLSGWPSD
ncbi:MAG: thiamine phosphate synthase [Hyphomonadaceae bacterium]